MIGSSINFDAILCWQGVENGYGIGPCLKFIARKPPGQGVGGMDLIYPLTMAGLVVMVGLVVMIGSAVMLVLVIMAGLAVGSPINPFLIPVKGEQIKSLLGGPA